MMRPRDVSSLSTQPPGSYSECSANYSQGSTLTGDWPRLNQEEVPRTRIRDVPLPQ